MAEHPDAVENHSHLSSASTVTLLNPADIAAAPRCSLEEHARHRAIISGFRPTPENNRQIATLFATFVNDPTTYREIKAVCRTIYTLITFDFARILSRLENPLIRLTDLSDIPSFTLKLFSEILESLKTVETDFRTALYDLEDLELSHQVPSATAQLYVDSLSCSLVSEMLGYWIESSMDAIQRCQEACARVELQNSQSRSSFLASPQLGNLNPVSSSPVSPRSTFLDLHKIRINKFSGKPEEFSQFFGVLTNALDSNSHYSEMSKITFVLSLLAGEPLEMIQAIPIVEGSLRLILNALQRRYGDKRAHYQRLLKELKDKKYSVPRTQAELKDWYYRLMIMRDSLVSSPSLSNVHSPGLLSENELFISHVLESLPEDIHRSIELHFEHSAIVPTVDDILSYLDSIIRSRERFSLSRDKDSHFRSPQLSNTSNFHRERCAFCDRSHRSKDCRTVSDHSRRQQVIREKNLCARCLCRSHVSSQCRSPMCSQCQGDHHISICSQAFPSSNFNFNQPHRSFFGQSTHSSPPLSSTFPNNLETPRASSFPPSNPPAVQPTNGPSVQMRTVSLPQNEEVMSPMVTVSGFRDPVKAFIDTGSQVSFVDLGFCRSLQLPLDSPIIRTVIPVGGNVQSIQTFKTSVSIVPKSGPPVAFRVLAIENLHEFFMGQPADSGQVPIRIVLGQDCLAKLEIQSSNHVTPDGLRVMSCRFGHFLVSENSDEWCSDYPIDFCRIRKSTFFANRKKKKSVAPKIISPVENAADVVNSYSHPLRKSPDPIVNSLPLSTHCEPAVEVGHVLPWGNSLLQKPNRGPNLKYISVSHSNPCTMVPRNLPQSDLPMNRRIKCKYKPKEHELSLDYELTKSPKVPWKCPAKFNWYLPHANPTQKEEPDMLWSVKRLHNSHRN
ncbi:unnamed protein product [Bursaphelenchus xylophilus]|nr:unnamed protein product [Bursaphelenchus xylophilus]CAG9114260.1 unnamed protein product [Bursaphelenchus xylophilus]